MSGDPWEQWQRFGRREAAIDTAVIRVAKRLYGDDWVDVIREWLTREPLFTTRREIIREFNEIMAA